MSEARNITISPAVMAGFAALAISLGVSGNLLFLIGINYSTPGGALPEKLHPATYCAALALLLLLTRGVTRSIRHNPGVWLFLAMMLLCVAFQALTGGTDRLVIYMESFMPAGALAIVFAQASAHTRRILAWALLTVLLLNVGLALIETVQQQNWIPIYLGDHELVAEDAEFRPTALYDHPLTGAMLSMIGLLLATAADMAAWRRAALVLAFTVGVLAFGGRAALAGSLATLGLRAGMFVLRRAINGHLRLVEIAGMLAALVAAIAAAAVLLAATTVGARIVEHFYWDDSAAARGVEWQILGMLDTGEWLFGVSRDRMELLIANLGLRYSFVAVENFWLLIFLNLGLFGFPLFLTGFVALLASTFRAAGGTGRALLVAVMAVASTSNSLGRKSNVLTILIPAVVATTGFAKGRTDVG